MRVRPTALVILSACAFLMWPREATAQRLVRASVWLDGKVLLGASTGDDGHIDADGVWEYLKRLKLQPTEEFKKLNVDPTAKEVTLSSKGPKGERIEIVVRIAYGGRATPRKLKLVRVPKDEYGGEWSLAPAEVDGMFNLRLINRELASRLRKPKELKPWGTRKR